MDRHKELLITDARIAKIRDDIAAGKLSLGSMSELDDLVEERSRILREVEISKTTLFGPRIENTVARP